MARVNVYLPDELAAEARAERLNVSALAQEAIRGELRRRRMRAWLDDMRAWREQQPEVDVTHEDVIAAIRGAREEFGRWPRDTS